MGSGGRETLLAEEKPSLRTKQRNQRKRQNRFDDDERMFGLLKKSKPQQDVHFPFKTVNKETKGRDKTGSMMMRGGSEVVIVPSPKTREATLMCLIRMSFRFMFVHPTVPIRLTEPSRVRLDWSFGWKPRPDDRTDRTRARLPRPTRHSKTHGQAKLSLGRDETEDGHAISSMMCRSPRISTWNQLNMEFRTF
ncbi:hypothetical protein DY000_02060304 [Brassica cretica]|uniref:Uncharacterized protein n=1 Tax=Brassica cretica TaxID=69181 RepID=A0ABQ7AQM9_BRACR|nr:hypothetical protein DY000_02060304 [Brassica cretica]